MSSYKSFTINEPSSPAPWGTVENQAWKDVIDTLVIGTLAGAKSATKGHRHGNLFEPSDTDQIVLVTDTGQVEIYTDSTLAGHIRFCPSHADLSGYGIYFDTTDGIQVRGDDYGAKIAGGTGGHVVISAAVTSGKHVVIPNIASSTAGLTTGMLWADSNGFVKRVA